ncbi:GNAT family N-acetyltransferase [Paeniglutamicibacter cryotolerans]|uniref:Putative N-acetyltransferase YhbS n=1 Tax=Paeniglutamicibacter cryotolerans TaxID=670079 RepID=A0A839QV86_9MICC|nr:GNAT family N-acetyltransferase [Paeniglutamicibacter cryotolerans]MBB2995911.1 putative N-acetyltransferase YhbS [Paeniglutamicibacter cryotolerans]
MSTAAGVEPLQVTEALPAEYERIAGIFNRSLGHTAHPESRQSIQDAVTENSASLYAIRAGSEIVGSVCLEEILTAQKTVPSGTVLLRFLVIDPFYQRRGFGKRAINELAAQLLRLGKSYFCYSSTIGNHGALNIGAQFNPQQIKSSALCPSSCLYLVDISTKASPAIRSPNHPLMHQPCHTSYSAPLTAADGTPEPALPATPAE